MSKTKYVLKFHTGDEYLAGTDSNIFVTLFGTLGQSDEYRLNGLIKRNAFERNHTDSLSLELPESIGDIYSIELRSDCMYAGSGWLLDYIEVTREENNAPTSHFSCRTWIEDKKVKTFNVTSGLSISDDPKREIVTRSSGEKLHVPARQKMEYKQTLSIATGYSIKEIKITQIETNTSFSIEGGFGAGGSNSDAKTTSLKAALSFALKSLNSTQKETQMTFDGKKELNITTTIENATDQDKVYDVMINVTKNQHKVIIGSVQFDIPEYLSAAFAGVRESVD